MSGTVCTVEVHLGLWSIVLSSSTSIYNALVLL